MSKEIQISVDPTDLLDAIRKAEATLEQAKFWIFQINVSFGNINDQLKKFKEHVKIE